MSVEVWYTQDIRQIILAAVRANEQALAAERADSDLPHELAYHQGFKAALSILALALGLTVPLSTEHEEQCAVVESPIAIDTALGFLPSDRHGDRAHQPAFPPSGG